MTKSISPAEYNRNLSETISCGLHEGMLLQTVASDLETHCDGNVHTEHQIEVLRLIAYEKLDVARKGAYMLMRSLERPAPKPRKSPKKLAAVKDETKSA